MSENGMARQKEFNRDEVLHKATEVFWTRGYERASMQDLVEHMGINRQSIYDTFGDKHDVIKVTLSVLD
jgi:TetR/AcrR family transcriptional regulator, transcriptional repressor for nem operon